MPVTCSCFQFATTAWFFSSCYVLFLNRPPLFELANTCDNAGYGFDFFFYPISKIPAVLKAELSFIKKSHSFIPILRVYTCSFSINLSFANCRNACRKKSKNLISQTAFLSVFKMFPVSKIFQTFFVSLLKYQIFSQVLQFIFLTELSFLIAP